MAAIRPKTRGDLAFAEITGEGVVYDPVHGLLHYLNPEAAAIFDLLDGTATIAQISHAIADAVNAPAETIERQVRAVYRELRNRELIDRRQAFLTSSHTNGDRRELVRREVPHST